MIRELALEHRFVEIQAETLGMYSFIRQISHGRIRINFVGENIQVVTLIITKDVKGSKNFIMTFPSHEYQTVYKIFHSPNSFRK
jgi:acylphosphatase